MFTATDVIIALGTRGSGKSTLTRKIALDAYPKLIIIDRMREWSEAQGCVIVESFDDFCAELKRTLHLPAFKICFQFEAEQNKKDEIFNHVLRLAYKRGGVAVLIEEVHFFASASSIQPWLFESIMTGRHAGIALICNSQRPASVSKALISQANHVFCANLFEKRDLEYLSDCIGECAYKLPELQKFQFLHFVPGQPYQIVKNR